MSLRDLLAKATPGPWEHDIEAGDEWWFGAGNQARIRAVEGAKWGSVAVLGCDSEMEEADARLIALAPELAALVLDMADALRPLVTEDSFVYDGGNTRDDIRALLARLDRISQ